VSSRREGELANPLGEVTEGGQGAPQHLAHAGQPEELPANSPPQAKILRKNRYVFNFFIQTLILI
jgi:hypothetical protein